MLKEKLVCTEMFLLLSRLVGFSPEMERTRMRVALLCCWLDCDSSLAGASLVSLVCNDGSDLQDRIMRVTHHNSTDNTEAVFKHNPWHGPNKLQQTSVGVVLPQHVARSRRFLTRHIHRMFQLGFGEVRLESQAGEKFCDPIRVLLQTVFCAAY